MKLEALSHIGKSVKMVRKAQKMTQGDLAKAIDVSTPTIVKLEQGEENITFSKIEKVLSHLGLLDIFQQKLHEFEKEVEKNMNESKDGK